jgi:hypothetical protein
MYLRGGGTQKRFLQIYVQTVQENTLQNHRCENLKSYVQEYFYGSP